MFGFLKEKLKSAISKISRKVEEEAPKEEIEVETKVKEEKPKYKKKSEKVKSKKKFEFIEEEHKHKPEDLTPEEEIAKEPEKIVGVKIIYFAHGTTPDNEKGIFSGQSKISLSKLGKQQSKDLTNKINVCFDVIFTSDLPRAIESAKLTWPDKEIIEDKRLRELDVGDFTNKPENIIEDFINDNGIHKTLPNGESLKDLELRIKDFINDIYKKYYGKHIAIVAHKYTQLAIEVLLNNKTWEQAIKEDWRHKKIWQPGWNYKISNNLEIKEEKKGFFSKLKEKFARKEEEIKPIEEKTETIEEKPEIKEEKKGFFGIIKEKITTTKISEEKFEELFYDLELAMLENNVAFEVVEKIKEDMKKTIVEKSIKRGKVEDEIKNSLKESIEDLFNVEKIDLLERIKEKKPFVICFVGVNGSGKTTSIAKVAYLLQKNKKSVVLAAADTFRAAAIQQLKEWGNKLSVKVIAHDYGSDPAAVAFDSIKYAEAHGMDVVLIDTAGRLHSNIDLVREMQKIIRVAKPNLKIFVGEAITGNDCVEQAKEFNNAINIDAIILAKADVDEKGGAMISTSFVTHKPILFLGVGQSESDLKEFNKDEIIKGLDL
ncbi:signal recognition particle-docking protein FtsY [Candidatus Woesearchaeota archaeon]|nr:signal recognition particle-docking protein FtsY [Candidatus Woesearchaeota archaeon]